MSIIAATIPTIRPLWSKDIRSRYKRTGYTHHPSTSSGRTREKLSNGSSTVPNTLNSGTGNSMIISGGLHDRNTHTLDVNDLHELHADEMVI